MLLGLWFGGFVLTLGAVFYLYARGWIHQESFQASAKQLNDLYAPYVGAIALFYWGARAEAPATAGRGGGGGGGFFLAFAVSGLWNLLVIALVVPLLFDVGTIEESLDNLRGIVGLFSWLVGGAVGYYFRHPAVGDAGAGQP